MQFNFFKITVVLSFIFFISNLTSAQKYPFDSDQWEFNCQGKIIEPYKGNNSLYLQNGRAYLKDVEFLNGIIEFDILFRKERGFTGVFFRMLDQQNFEDFYFRPHQSGMPDANQYTPVFNGSSGWQLYHGKAYGNPYEYAIDEWMHIKLIVAGSKAELYIDNMEEPFMIIPKLLREPKAGTIGFNARLTTVRFANLSIQKMDNPPLKGVFPERNESIAPGTINNWLISETFSEKVLESIVHLSEKEKNKMEWQKLKPEPSGTINIARLRKRSPEKNTVFAKVIIDSEVEKTKILQLGYSDRVKVFCNDQLIYRGNNNYISRDFRYLGTIGYFDEIALPLKKGANEIWVAVSENFGGWGLRGKLLD